MPPPTISPTLEPTISPTLEPTQKPTLPYPAPTPAPTLPVVVVPVIQVQSGMAMSGTTADQFNRPEKTVIFAQAVEDSLTVQAEVTNVVATDIVRRSLSRRQLLQSGINVDYTLQMAIETGGTSSRLVLLDFSKRNFCH